MATIEAPTLQPSLHFLADRYEQAQRVRIETGERIRAIYQGRDQEAAWEVIPSGASFGSTYIPDGAPFVCKSKACEHKWRASFEIEPPCPVCDGESCLNVDVVLKDILASKHDGPMPILARTYRRHHEEEREMFGAMTGALERHPTWGWLQKVKGVGPTLACKLLARLDITRADTPSSFWLYCGLATVPGAKYHCLICGLDRTFPISFDVKGGHKRFGTEANCKGKLEKTDEGDHIRAAMPRATRGQKRPYDGYAKKVCYLLGCQWEKLGDRSPYARFYRKELAQLDRDRPGWAKGRKRFTAMRVTEKLFLSNLHEVWRAALGLPYVEHYAASRLGHDGRITPDEMVEE